MRGALTRAMTNALVRKVVNMTMSRTNALPTWSTWLSDWKREDGAKVNVDRVGMPAEMHQKEAEEGSADGFEPNPWLQYRLS